MGIRPDGSWGALWFAMAVLASCAIDQTSGGAAPVAGADGGPDDAGQDVAEGSRADTREAGTMDAQDKPRCGTPKDCAPTFGCVDWRCVAGECVAEPDDGLCVQGTRCEVAWGCTAVDWEVGEWSSCPEACGEHTQAREVMCVRVSEGQLAVEGDEACPSPKPEVEQRCLGGAQGCGWGSWGEWGSCSASCGGGEQVRERSCEVAERCEGEAAESRACNTQACCPTCGAWSLQPKCNCDTGRRCDIRYCTQCNGASVREVGACRTDCPNGCL